MLLNAYTVYDNKTLTYSPPFFQAAHGAATRMFSDLVQDTNTTIGRHPSDYSLFCVAKFDDQTGFLQALDAREHIVDAASLLPKQADFFANGSGDVRKTP